MTQNTSAQPLIHGGAQTPRAALPHLPPLALYIHIPWCVRKCPYCDFNSHTASKVLPEEEYVDALLADLDQDLHAVYENHYRGKGWVKLEDAPADGKLDAVALKNTNLLEVRVHGNDDLFHAVCTARLDNLGKGASGAAVHFHIDTRLAP